MKYYYFDMCTTDEPELQSYKDFEEFKDGILWNRDIAHACGDKVISKKELIKTINKGEDFSIELNGATFIMCKDINTFEDGYYVK